MIWIFDGWGNVEGYVVFWNGVGLRNYFCCSLWWVIVFFVSVLIKLLDFCEMLRRWDWEVIYIVLG